MEETVRTSKNSQGMDELESKVSRLRDGVSEADLCTTKELKGPLCLFTFDWIRPP